MSINSFKSKRDYTRKPFSVTLERNNQVIFSRSFYCNDFNYKTINSTLPNNMLSESLLVISDMLKKKSVDYLWKTTNLYRVQDEKQMQVSIDWFASKGDDILKLSFFQGRQLLASGEIELNAYPTTVREIIDMTGAKTIGGGPNLFEEIVEIFDDYMSVPTYEIKSIEDEYNVANKFPRISEHYRDMIHQKNKEHKEEMTWL